MTLKSITIHLNVRYGEVKVLAIVIFIRVGSNVMGIVLADMT